MFVTFGWVPNCCLRGEATGVFRRKKPRLQALKVCLSVFEWTSQSPASTWEWSLSIPLLGLRETNWFYGPYLEENAGIYVATLEES